MKRIFSLLLIAGLPAFADVVTASLYTPALGTGTLVPIVLNGVGIGVPSNATIPDNGSYSVTFSVPGGQGVVQNASSGNYAIPVAGVKGGQPEHLTGDYGSNLTTDPSQSGNYFSTGVGSITIAFDNPQYWFALLWGSIDVYNSLTFNNGPTITATVTGAEAQNLTSGFVSNGYQGWGGSAYVLIHTTDPFMSVTASSTSPSFEFAGVEAAGAESNFSLPEPSAAFLTILMAGVVLALAGLLKRKLA